MTEKQKLKALKDIIKPVITVDILEDSINIKVAPCTIRISKNDERYHYFIRNFTIDRRFIK